MSNGIQRGKGRKKKGGGQRELVVVVRGCWRMRPVDGRKERADQQSVIWYWPHLVVLCCCALLFLLFISPFVALQPWRDPPTCCPSPLPKIKEKHTRCPCRLCGNFGSARRCVVSPRCSFFPPKQPGYFFFAVGDKWLLFWVGGCVNLRCSCHGKRRPLSRTS